jgi:hypothetical protein
MTKQCDNCTHTDVCKFKDISLSKQIPEPFEISCEHFNAKPITYVAGLNQPFTVKSLNGMCVSCAYYIKGECKAPDNMILPCQQITCESK